MRKGDLRSTHSVASQRSVGNSNGMEDSTNHTNMSINTQSSTNNGMDKSRHLKSSTHNATSRVGRTITAGRHDGARNDGMEKLTAKAILTYVFIIVCFVANLKVLSLRDSPVYVIEQQGHDGYDAQSPAQLHGDVATDPSHDGSSKQRPRIALLASFVPQLQPNGKLSTLKEFDNVVNKACYANIWGYDFVFNMTADYTQQQKKKAPWLNFGAWNRVPQSQALLHNYDWILYGDLDHVFRDMARPLESFLREFELYNQTPSVFLPTDNHARYFTFSTYAYLIKNSPFSHNLLENWHKFALGLCPKGNFPMTYRNGVPIYSWEHSDQPGLWYALVQTYEDYYHTGIMKKVCNNATGYIDTDRAYGPETNQYFRKNNVTQGHAREHLMEMKDQPIIWSTTREKKSSHDYGGLGLQMNFATELNDTRSEYAFALHQSNSMSNDFKTEVEYCKKVHGCYARYDRDNKLEIGCKGRKFTVVQ